MAEARGEPPKANSNLAVRIASAVVAAPILVGLLYEGPPWSFYILALSASLVGAWELFNMTHAGDRPSQTIGVAMTAVASLAMWFWGSDVRILATLVLFVPLLGPLLTLFSIGDMKTAALRACAMGFGPLFIGIPLTALALLRKDLPDGAGYVVVAILFAWFSDTGGYFAGRFFGKHKLYEAVSPKKTMEGAVGGLVGSVFAAVLAHAWFLPSLSLIRGIVLALVAGALGQAGDLGESLLKRSTGIKDSGAIVPGHGGILDRVDALLVTSAVTYAYSLWFLR
ncbi:MAG: phosphatidate cytidylyltransferase [Polyangiaceae bacterium]|nr:phosphatidate cytidylyltransferase [Polyangiaceae bacterium]